MKRFVVFLLILSGCSPKHGFVGTLPHGPISGSVAHDTTLSGDGTSDTPLGVSGGGSGAIADGGVTYPLVCNGTGPCGSATNPLHIADAGITFTDIGTVKTAVTNVTTLTISGIDCNKDGDYRLAYHLVGSGASTPIYTLQPNGITTNQNSTFFIAGTGTSTTTDLRLGALTAPETEVDGTGVFSCISSREKTLSIEASTIGREFISTGVWQETSTDTTSIVVLSSVGSGLFTGSWIKIQRLGATN